MSDNRIWLRCRKCGKAMLLGKMGLSDYGVYTTFYENLDYVLDVFFKRHSFKECSTDKFEGEFDDPTLEPKFIPKDCNFQNHFEIAYDFYYEE